jgi:amino acid adenylation domain-containing protein
MSSSNKPYHETEQELEEQDGGVYVFPVSFAQQRLWFLDQLEPGSALYNVPVFYHLQGTLDAALLRESLTEIIWRHESLRTTFEVEEGEPVQVVHPEPRLDFSCFDLHALAPDEREGEAQRLAREEAERPFDLSRGPLLRVRLISLTAEQHLLVLNMHHIISDGWSLGVFMNELTSHYTAFLQGGEVDLPDPPIQYADYAIWQREYLQGEILAEQLSYWKQKLGGEAHVLQLPTDRPRTAKPSSRGGFAAQPVARAVRDRLEQLSKKEGTTLFMTMLAAFKALLYRCTGQEDIRVGTPIAGRNRAEIEPLIGFFVNTLVMATRVEGNLSFCDLLHRVKESALGAYAHQDLPFEKLVEELAPQRDLTHSPLFQVLFTMEDGVTQRFELPGLVVTPADMDSDLAKFDLILQVVDHGGEMHAGFNYNADLFEEKTILRLLDRFTSLLTWIAEEAEAPLATWSLLTEAERMQVLIDWNATAVDYPQQTVQELFEAQAARHPHAVAVIDRDRRMTYGELNARANQVAHALRRAGVEPNTFVGLCMDRSFEMVIGLLGIVKAGGAYVPFDPSYPEDRLTFMAEETDVQVLLTQLHLRDKLPALEARTLCLDEDWAAHLAAEPESNPLHDKGTLDDLIYVVYTSGSTGRPKGVAVPHRGVVRLVQNPNYIELDREQVFLQFAPISFDAATFEIWGSLLNGAQLVLYTEPAPTLEDLGHVIRRHGVTTLWLTAGLFHQMVEERLDDLKSLNYLLAGGDVLSAAHVKKALQALPGCTLINGYGPTENTTFTCCYPMTDAEQVGTSVSIGRPIANTQVYVLDSFQQPVPVGVPGELYIGGDGLAAGYLKRPELTAQTFIPHPFSEKPHDTLYKTGDLVRWLPDGNLEFLGRIDGQVKIRGFRIELGEVEAAIALDPRVKTNIVIAREDTPGDKRLVAYVVPVAGAELSGAALRPYLKAALPDYLVPSAFVILEELPLNPNGKVDKSALPAPETGRDAAGAYIAPRNPIEEKVAAIWSQVLRVELISVEDPFFELGGHSLLATQIISRVREAFSVNLPLRSLFEAPTVAGMAEHVQLALGENHPAQAAIQPAPRTGHPELSYAQKRLWFLDQLEPGGTAYNMTFPLRMKGQLNTAALEQSVQEIVRRHEALRTTFADIAGEPRQVIHPYEPFRVPILELEASELEAWLKRAAEQPYDLTAGPLFRAELLQLAADDHVLLLNMHHIVSDGWSIGVLTQELSALYESYRAGLPSPLPELPIQYADFAAWQQRWLTGDVLETQLGYWRQQLGGDLPPLQLPTDHPRPEQPTYRGHVQVLELPSDLADRLRTLSQEAGATLFMTLLAAFKTLLYRYTGETDLRVGTPIAGRTREEIEGLIGFFVNTLVLRTDLSDAPTFRDLIGRVREVTLGAYAHQDLPFERIVEELQPGRDVSHSPLFQAMFVLQNAGTGAWGMSGLDITLLEQDELSAKFDLLLTATEKEEGIDIAFVYSTDLYEADTIQRMTRHFRTLLEAMAASADQPIAAAPMLTPEEYRHLVLDLNQTEAEYPSQTTAHQLFEVQAEKTPTRIAVAFEEERITYAELNARANRLARHLQQQGVQPDTLVGIFLDRSPEMIVSVLAVMKAGGGYVPLDPAYPMDRLAYMLDDTQVPLLLTQSGLADRLPPHTATLICLDLQHPQIQEQSDENAESAAGPEHLAYVIYTSGSTGRPKGVLLEHRGLCNLAGEQIANFAVDENSRVLQFASFNFDVSVSEIFTALFSGAMLVLAPREKLLPGPELAQLMRDMEISVVMLTASVLGVLYDEEFPALRTVVTGGEAASAEVVARWSQGRRFVNVYGATEATVYSTYAAYSDASHALDVGVPIANTTLYLLDANKQPVPVGIPGECYIGGEALARGYLNRPELNAEKFLPDPFSSKPGARLYKTGDLLVYTRTGKLEFVGRIDDQVKIRGFRVELGEIETALGQHALVREAVVLVREDTPGFKRLAAYVVPKVPGDEQEIVARLRTALQSRFPDYMVPSAIVLLEMFPMTPNGKVDKRALPIPAERLGLEEEYVAPRGETEANIAEIWSQLLGVEQVGVHDNFFALGGHSLLATQVVSRLRNSFRADVPLRLLFEGPTVAQLATALEAMREGAPSLQEHPILPVPRDVRLPLSYAQQRLWFLDKLEPGSTAYNSPSALRLQGQLDLNALEASLHVIVERHESLRTTFQEIDGEPVQVIAPAAAFPFEHLDLTSLPSSERAEWTQKYLQEEDQWQFDLSRGPLFRARVVRVEAEEHLLLLNMHHIVSDGWSMGVFAQELAACYEAFCHGESVQLPDLPIQYADFAHWQQELLQGDVLDAQLSYWKKQLAGRLPVLQLPTDAPRPAKQTFRGSYVSLDLPKELSDRLAQIGQQEATTLYMTLLSAFKVLLYRYSGQEDVLVGTPVAGRNREEIEGLIGFFVNTLVLRSALSAELTFRELLAQVREVSIGAYAHQDLPFEKLVEVLAPDRDMSHTPLFQVMFTFQNAEDQALHLPGLTISHVEPEHETAKFDLTLAMAAEADGLIATMEYNTDLFRRETIQRMIQHFQTLLESIAADADQTLSALPLLQQEERNHLLSLWQEGHVFEAAERTTIHQRFEQQARQSPDLIALVDQDRRWTYRELNEQANRLAHCLQQRGVAPEVLVGLMLERSAEVVIGILAILKAGGAYVPLDPTYPPERLAFMLEDSQVSVLLTQERFMAGLPPHEAHAICFDRDRAEIEQQSAENPTSPVTADNLAYVIYTSGSTGKPKGVLIQHGNVTRLFDATESWYQFGASDVWTLFHSYAFDFSVWEIWGALLYGGRLVVVPYLVSRSPEAFRQLLCEEGVTVLNQTPSAFYQLMQADELAGNAASLALRYVILGGEALDLQSLKSWFTRHGDLQPQLVNMYGITETTVHVTCRPIARTDLEAGAGSVIGLPIPDLQLYVLDAHLQPVPYGVTGEMYVGGAGVARGYLNRPDLTEERFVADPFRAGAHKMYRTGDLARLLPSGELEYQGRIDHQVKIRGFRIELGEIEAALSAHPAVETNVVIAREDIAGDKRLVAYLVGRAAQEPLASADLRRYLQEKLPDYMVPSAFVTLDAMQLTANGKVDKRALPAPDTAGAGRETEYVAPRNRAEQQLADIWVDVIGVERVGVTDNFFAIGGHSLLAVRLIAEVRKHLQADLPLSLLFQEGTVEQMAAYLREQDGLGKSLVPMKTNGSKPPFFFIHPGGGSVFSYLDLVRALDIERPFYALQARGLEDDQEPIEDVEALAAHYIREMQSVQAAGPYHLGGWSFGGVVAYEMARQLQERGEGVAMLTLLDSQAPGWAGGEELEEDSIFHAFALDLTSQFGLEPPDLAEGATWTRETALEDLFQAVMRERALPTDQGLEMFTRMYRVFRANLIAYAHYAPSASYSGTWTLLKASEQDPTIQRDDLLGWSAFDVEKLTVATIPGQHFSMMREPQVEEIAKHFQRVGEQIRT